MRKTLFIIITFLFSCNMGKSNYLEKDIIAFMNDNNFQLVQKSKDVDFNRNDNTNIMLLEFINDNKKINIHLIEFSSPEKAIMPESVSLVNSFREKFEYTKMATSGNVVMIVSTASKEKQYADFIFDNFMTK